jgi:transcriptional regulator with XRE-family HTH domain
VKEEFLDSALKHIGTKLVELRKEKGYTSHESFAYDHDIPRVHYWRLENGKSNLTIRSLMKVLAVHDLTLRQFFVLLPEEAGAKPLKASSKQQLGRHLP